MTPREANAFLARVAQLDPRFGWGDAEELVLRAEEWAVALFDVSYQDALAAARAHYRETRDRLMPADVVARCPARLGPDPVADRARAEWLAARGLTETDVAAMSRAELKRLVYGGGEVTAGEC